MSDAQRPFPTAPRNVGRFNYDELSISWPIKQGQAKVNATNPLPVKFLQVEVTASREERGARYLTSRIMYRTGAISGKASSWRPWTVSPNMPTGPTTAAFASGTTA